MDIIKIYSIEEMERLGKKHNPQFYKDYIPRNYEALEYPVFVKWLEPWDNHSHGNYTIKENFTDKEYNEIVSKRIDCLKSAIKDIEKEIKKLESEIV